jgi:hypothetical protein
MMGYKVTPAGGKNLYNTSDPRNTWNGPIVTGKDIIGTLLGSVLAGGVMEEHAASVHRHDASRVATNH